MVIPRVKQSVSFNESVWHRMMGKITPVVSFAITDVVIPITTTSFGWLAKGAFMGEMDPEIVQDPRGDPNAADRIFIAHPNGNLGIEKDLIAKFLSLSGMMGFRGRF